MKIAIIGYGKMGKMIEQLLESTAHQIVLKIGTKNPEDLNEENLKKADVAIEFSRPEAAFKNIMRCIEAGIPVISGTTGWLDKKPEVEAYCKDHQGAFLYASNFSIGVNLFFALNKYLAGLMNTQTQYQPSIEEIHHTQKLDAPSGTAITIAEGLLQNNDYKNSWVCSEEEHNPNIQKDELEILSKRIEAVPGTHVVNYQSIVDSIEIKHTAHSREGFAKGAILAAEWIVGKQGCFSMQDVLEIQE